MAYMRRRYFAIKIDYQALKQKNIFRSRTMINNICRLPYKKKRLTKSIFPRADTNFPELHTKI